MFGKINLTKEDQIKQSLYDVKDDLLDELVKLDKIITKLESIDPTIPGSFTGTLSERLIRQLNHIKTMSDIDLVEYGSKIHI